MSADERAAHAARHREVVGLLVCRGLLTEAEAMATKLDLEVSITDERADRSAPLPVLPGTTACQGR